MTSTSHPAGALKAAATAGGTAGFGVTAAFGPTRKLLGRFLPAPGEGPSPEAQEAGFFDLRLHGLALALGARGPRFDPVLA